MQSIVRMVVGLAVLMIVGGGRGWAYEVDTSHARPEGAKQQLSVTQPAPQEGKASEDEETQPMRVSMDFQDANLKDVLKTFSQQTGINVIAGADVPDQPVTLYLEDVTVMDALDQILKAANLTYERPLGSDIYVVKAKRKEDERALTVTRVYRLKYARVSKSILAKAAAALSGSTPFSGSAVGSVGGGLTGGGGGGGGGDIGIDSILQKLLTDKGAVVVDGRTNSLILTDVPENFPRLEAALIALDVRTPQIMVDAEVIETSLAKAKEFGVKWGNSAGTVFTFTPARASTKFPFSSILGSHIGGPRLHQTGGDATISPLGVIGADAASAALQALESDTDTKILARPKVLTLDNESAIIRLTAEEAVGITSGSQANTNLVTATPERQTTGVVLIVTPQVNDSGYITMLVEPSVTKTVPSNITVVSGTTPRDPKTRSMRSLVRIRGGETLVVGGLIDRSEQETLTQVPVLSGIPFVGEAFKHKEIRDSASELIVFITPRVLDEPVQTQVASTPQGPMGMREQEPAGARQENIEQRLNALEEPPQ